MARHARIYSSIWADTDFLATPKSGQRLFLFLVSQPDIDNAGVLALRKGRWSYCAPDETLESIDADLAELAERRFIVIDPRTEEVLVRSFMRWDNVWRQPNIAASAGKSIRALTSPDLRAAIRVELLRITLDPSGMKAHIFAEVSKLREALIDELGEGSGKSSDMASPNPSENPSENPSPKGEGMGVQVSSTGNPPPQPLSPTPSIPPPAGRASPRQRTLPGAPDLPPSNSAASAQTLVGEWIDNCRERPPARVIGHVSKELKLLLDEGIPYDTVRIGLANWHRAGQNPSTLASFVNAVMNASPNGGRRSATDDKLAALDALKDPEAPQHHTIQGRVL